MWNYRVVVEKVSLLGKTFSKNEILVFEIKSVYYSQEEIPNACSKEPEKLSFESLEDLNSALEKMAVGAKKPPLIWNDELERFVEFNH